MSILFDYQSQSGDAFAGERRFSKSMGLSASVSFPPLPLPSLSFIFGSRSISRAVKVESPLPRSFFAPKQNGNDCYAGYFSSIGRNLERGIQSSASHRSFLNGSFTQSIFFNPTTQDEIAEIAKTFLPGKAAGYDQIPMTVIKESILLVSEPLTHIINLSIQHGIVPDEMKIARVIPIFKSDDQSLFTLTTDLPRHFPAFQNSLKELSNAIPDELQHPL